MIDYKRNVYLDTIDDHSLEMLRDWRNDPRIYKWCRQTDLIMQAHQKSWYNSVSGSQQNKMYLVKVDDPHLYGELSIPVGVCGLTDMDLISRRAEFSLYIAPKFQRRGYARKALATLLDHGFNNYGLNLIWGESFVGNPAIKLFKSLGFVEEGIRRSFYFKDGEYIDALLFSMKASEWRF